MKTEKEVITEGKLNEIVYTTTRRPNGTIRIQQGFEFCPSLAEQHTSELTDLNVLIQKYKPDELAAYLLAKGVNRHEIVGHDFSQEPNKQQAMNVVYRMKKQFDNLPEEVKMNFKNHVEFLKFIDNPLNQEKMIKLGLMTAKEVKAASTPTPPTTTEEKKETNEKQ